MTLTLTFRRPAALIAVAILFALALPAAAHAGIATDALGAAPAPKKAGYTTVDVPAELKPGSAGYTHMDPPA